MFLLRVLIYIFIYIYICLCLFYPRIEIAQLLHSFCVVFVQVLYSFCTAIPWRCSMAIHPRRQLHICRVAHRQRPDAASICTDLYSFCTAFVNPAAVGHCGFCFFFVWIRACQALRHTPMPSIERWGFDDDLKFDSTLFLHVPKKFLKYVNMCIYEPSTRTRVGRWRHKSCIPVATRGALAACLSPLLSRRSMTTSVVDDGAVGRWRWGRDVGRTRSVLHS